MEAALTNDAWRADMGLMPLAAYNTAVGVLANVSAILPALKAGRNTEVGRQALATVMTAVVEPAGQTSSVSNAQYAQHLGINDTSVAEARERRAATLDAAAAGTAPPVALAGGQWLYHERHTRSDKLCEAMVTRHQRVLAQRRHHSHQRQYEQRQEAEQAQGRSPASCAQADVYGSGGV